MNREARRHTSWRRTSQTGSIAETARRPHTSRDFGRKWVQRYYRDNGVKGLRVTGRAGPTALPPKP
jgi:hypothetical protein